MKKIKLYLFFFIAILSLLGCENIEKNVANAINDEFVVTIDAGHGIDTDGKCAYDNSFREWEINNEVAIKVEELLEEQGIRVERVDDITGKNDIPLEERLEKAIDYNSDLHISIHQNADSSQSDATGIEVYYNSSSSERNQNFAIDLSRRISDYITTTNRGWKASDDNLFITREFCKNGIDAVLTEGLFMTNLNDIEYMSTEQYAYEYGSAIADSVLINYRNEITFEEE